MSHYDKDHKQQTESESAKAIQAAASLYTDLATASPSAVDHALSVLGEAANRYFGYIESERQFRDKPYNAKRLAEIDARIADYTAAIASLNAACQPLRAEFERRPWSRYSIVHRGHFHHMPTVCGSLRWTFWGRTATALAWQHSGKDAKTLVAETQDDACTRCFPWAPVKTKTIDPLRCPGSGKEFDDQEHQRLYRACSACGKYVGQTRSGTARHHRRPA